MANKETYHVKDGKIESIDAAPVNKADEPNKELDKLKADNVVLTAKVTALEASSKTIKDAHESELGKITVTLEKIQEGMGSDYKPPEARFKVKQAEGETPVQAAMRRKKEAAEAKQDK